MPVSVSKIDEEMSVTYMNADFLLLNLTFLVLGGLKQTGNFCIPTCSICKV